MFEDLPPSSAVIEYFDILVTNKPLYMTVYVDEDQTPTLFLERSALKGKPDTCRVFFSAEDVKHYIGAVSATRKIPEENLRAWESTCSNLAEFMPKFDSTLRGKGRAGICAVATMMHRSRFRDVDVFWTSHPEYMV
jgi:hypothetical protein